MKLSQAIIGTVLAIAPVLVYAQVASHASTTVKPATAVVSGNPVARVNQTMLTERDLVRQISINFPYTQQHGGKLPKGKEAEIRAQALHDIEFEELVYQDALRRGMTITPAKLRNGIEQFKK